MSNYQSTKIIYHVIYKQLQQSHQYQHENFLPILEATKQYLQLINTNVLLNHLLILRHQKYPTLYIYLHSTKNNHQQIHVSIHYFLKQINFLHYKNNQLLSYNLQDSKYHMIDFVYLIQYQEYYLPLILYNNENLIQMDNYQYQVI